MEWPESKPIPVYKSDKYIGHGIISEDREFLEILDSDGYIDYEIPIEQVEDIHDLIRGKNYYRVN